MTKVAVAGANGSAWIEQLEDDYNVTRVTGDLFNLRSAERALAGVELAFYAEDAMLSTVRLSQGSSADLDLLCADNFARAARKNGVREIVYVGSELSAEIERTLGSHGVRVTTRHVSLPRGVRTDAPTVARARSVQRLPLPRGRDAEWVAREYVQWLPRFMRPVLRAEIDTSRTCRFYLRGLSTPFLVLTFSAERSSRDRQLFFVTGGVLAHRSGVADRARLEFREVLDGEFVLAAVHDFAPSLPWLVYLLTQARIHLLVMKRFGAHLAATARE